MKTILTFAAIFFYSVAHSQTSYKFDTTATVNGCSNVLLQKISKDLQYELMIEINQIDSLPKFESFDLGKYSKFVTIYINKYPINNDYITEICADLRNPDRPIKPSKYIAQQGTIIITNWNGKTNISLILSNVKLKNKTGEKIKLPLEIFNNLMVGLNGG